MYISSKILNRTKQLLNQVVHPPIRYLNLQISRNEAKRLRKMVIKATGKKVVDQRLLKKIKRYCRESLGSSSFWPWLAYYTELRGGFVRGWIPDDYYRFELLPRMNPEKFMRFSEAKSIDHKLFKGSIIEPLFFRINGLYCTTEGILKTKAEIKRLLSSLDAEIIVKPDAGRGGKNIFFKHSADLSLENLPSGDFVFQKVVAQHTELSRLYPHSINTFRVLTYLDHAGAITIKFVIIRFGRGGARVDNASSGGGWIFVQSNGKAIPTAYDEHGLEMGTHHPDTGVKYQDLDLSFTDKVTAFCKKAHHNFPYVRIIGWDVFVDEGGEPKLIEWNANNPFFEIIEARFGPFFADLVLN